MKIFVITLVILISSYTTTFAKLNNRISNNANDKKGISLVKIWSTDSVLKTPESVLIDEVNGFIYVSNVNLNPWEKDDNGFISKLDLNGNILDLKWATGLSGPKGMGIYNNTLYVADIDELVLINTSDGKITKRYPHDKDASFNDITIGDNGSVYISGSGSNKIFKWKEEEFSVILEGEIGKPNGLFIEQDNLLVLTSGSHELYSINLTSKKKTLIADGFGHGDGIAKIGKQEYLTSNWKGEVFYVDENGQTQKLLDTKDQNINSADLDYSKKKNMVVIPTFYDNKVVAYKIIRIRN